MKPFSQLPKAHDLSRIRESLAGTRGREYWRSLEEVAQTPEFEALLHREFPALASELTDEVSRRSFLKFMGASLALSGLTACTRQSVQKIVPYVKQPEEMVPGQPLYFATAMQWNGFATGLLIESHEGHPTKVEGNPDHPSSLGATNVFHQASLLDLYDPDRSQSVTNAGEISSWGLFLNALNAALEQQGKVGGGGLRILTETVTSPTLAAQLADLLKKYPDAKWHQYQAISRDHAQEGARAAFGEIVETHYKFDQARVILSLDSDFLFAHPAGLRNARHFAKGRRIGGQKKEAMNRLYVMESTPSITGSMADHRLPLEAGRIEALTRALAHQLGISSGSEPGAGSNETNGKWIAAVARDLQANAGACIVIAGEQQPPGVHALVHSINEKLGNAGKTIVYTASAEAKPVNQLNSLKELVQDMDAGKVDLLVILGGNPVFNAPPDFQFADRLLKVKLRIQLSSHFDETSQYCHWHIPESHYLEAWSDTRAFDGTTSIVQPLIEPLYTSKSAHELLGVMIQQPDRNGYDIVRDYWKSQKKWPDFEKGWRRALHDGVIAGTELKSKEVKLKGGSDLPPVAEMQQSASTKLELSFAPDPTIWDGRFANNGWLQECPKPFTKLAWDNAALVSPSLAEREHLANGNVVQLKFRGRTLHVAVWIVPGQAENTVTLTLGYGRRRVGKVGSGTGFDAYALRTSDALWFGNGLELIKTSDHYHLVTTQHSHNIHGRDIIREANVKEFQEHPASVQDQGELPSRDHTLYNPNEFQDGDYAWGMAIDLNTCIGCNACITACQSENNIAVVGKDQIGRGRDMLWLRVDQYFSGGLDNPEVNNQPVPCMHCENAPCELVCPVAATLHDHDGLNLQVYNRCVGTRYCSNNCPYKVRRFNFLEYSNYHTPVLKAMRNPNVTVRWRGVMEKCTYCIQRISSARISAKEKNRRIGANEIMTACQQVCPVEAIVFGDTKNPDSSVSKLKASLLNYSMLGELNARPRTTYLAKLRNPNPELENVGTHQEKDKSHA
ncbi:TAT-variant-translocated molybdopterin oxidoreductase [Pedosphaera parvula]|uniref:Molybdopterin oxidoreductase, iron-sulfur binding subunit n=1 Tax=Pedosphaera parvula (strain Ellin514) TaxID=320771 RepID=B9XE59_PEDPL|nr:TAT-variant-translocated molybdopterin oxidoreductase [Pedosphaera parvula]EEF61950.1 molybdopterin oxidoreductase, iron-sulfur binding subunit [Pedosphaera parvula Ellin514]